MALEKVASLADLDDGRAQRVDVDGYPICLVRIGDQVKAIYDVCSHEEYALHEGYVYDNSIECALHGSTFDLDTGEAQTLPATTPVPVYAAVVDGDAVLVDVTDQRNDAPVPDHF